MVGCFTTTYVHASHRSTSRLRSAYAAVGVTFAHDSFSVRTLLIHITVGCYRGIYDDNSFATSSSPSAATHANLENDQARADVKLQNRWSSWNNLLISTSELLNRTLNVFNCGFIHKLEFVDIPRYNVLPILATLPNIKEVTSYLDITNEIIYRTLKVISPNTSKVNLYPRAEYGNPEKLQEILIENLDVLIIAPLGGDFRLHLDDILITNASKAVYNRLRLSEQDLNRFLKLWNSGKFNTRMEVLQIVVEEEFNRDAVLNGLHAVELPETIERTFEFSRNQILRKIVFGGYDIRRENGDLVTVDIRGLHYYNIYFWP
ncbi:hypothetical protein GCK72_022631 [Caenorhabditis remanei]|uniref:Sdz-33 F-box domain-containing protein n=1 Tax=Caenorhabditis remanei TaxID=31234 RepID=A0A6A5FU80_CAERE|nr:hypothetical protein GCK72_022631 [Caenorhabditis remanei]KAF1746178.1 hypothetical protein GCK72_022631 [Caenorhabditis remanei]